MDGDRLAGGYNTSEVVRIGDTVRRTRGPGTLFAAEVLRAFIDGDSCRPGKP
jgi:hypothetical protein